MLLLLCSELRRNTNNALLLLCFLRLLLVCLPEILEYAKWLGMDTETEKVSCLFCFCSQAAAGTDSGACVCNCNSRLLTWSVVVRNHPLVFTGTAVDRPGWPEGACARGLEAMVSECVLSWCCLPLCVVCTCGIQVLLAQEARFHYCLCLAILLQPSALQRDLLLQLHHWREHMGPPL